MTAVGGWALGLLFLSGAAALGHQLLWTRRMVDVLGAGPGTFARVVGVFFVGLALGAAWAALRPPTARNGWKQVAVAEAVVAGLSMVLLGATGLGDLLRGWLGGEVTGWILPLMLIGPPAIAMGRVFPAVVAALDGRRPGTLPLYLANTAGGILGLVGVTLWGLPQWGSDLTAVGVAGINVVVGVAALVLARRSAGFESVGERVKGGESKSGAGLATEVEGRIGWEWLAFGSGFWVVGLEVALQQQFAQVTIHSQFSGATVLAGVLVGLVLGSAWVVWRGGKGVGGPERWWAAWWVGALLVATEPHLMAALRPGLVALPYQLSPGAYYLRVAGLALVLIVPATVAAGVLFPVLLRATGSGKGSGGRVARLLAVNGLGGWIGAELMSIWLLPGFGLWLPMCVWGGIAVVFGAVLRGAGWLTVGWGGAVVLIVGWAGVGVRDLPQVTPVAGATIREVRVGREGVVGVMHRGADDWWITFNNTYTLGGSRAQMNQERQAHLPLLLHGRAKTVGLMGLATGSTAGGAVLHPGVERIVAAELSPAVEEFARTHFDPFNRGVLRDARVEVVLEDARLLVRDRPGTFDVVVGDLFLPWRTGEGRLFTREHFVAVRRSLKEDGLFCQWLPCFQLTRAQYDVIVRTFRLEFPGGFLIRGDFYADTPILGLVGFADGRGLGQVDWEGVGGLVAGGLGGAMGWVTDGLVRHVEGVAMCVVGTMPDPGSGPVNTLSNGWLEWDAGRNIVGLKSPWFIGVPAAEYVRDAVRGSVELVPAGLRAAHDSGQFFLTMEVASKSAGHLLGEFTGQVETRLPVALRADPQIRWEQWPGVIKPGPGGTNPG